MTKLQKRVFNYLKHCSVPIATDAISRKLWVQTDMLRAALRGLESSGTVRADRSCRPHEWELVR